MKSRIIITIDDDELSVGEAIELVRCIDYDHKQFDRDCLWEMSNGYYVLADITKLKTGIKINIWKKKG